MAETLMYHPKHGFKHARMDQEVAYDKSQGWHVYADLQRDAPSANPAPDVAPNPAPPPPVEVRALDVTRSLEAEVIEAQLAKEGEVPSLVEAQVISTARRRR